MSEEFKFWFQMIACAFGGGVTAYIATQAAFWKIDGRLRVVESKLDTHDREIAILREEMRDRPPRTPL